MNEYKQLLDVIQSMGKSDLKKYSAKVTEIFPTNTKAKVKFPNSEDIFTFLNKTGEVLSVGDSVYVECINNNLTNGYISQRFGEANWVSNYSLQPSMATPKYVNFYDVFNGGKIVHNLGTQDIFVSCYINNKLFFEYELTILDDNSIDIKAVELQNFKIVIVG